MNTELKPFLPTEHRTVTATIDENGDVLFLASDANDVFLDLGNIVTRRASHVEPADFPTRVWFHILRRFVSDKSAIAAWTRNWRCLWRVNTQPVGGPILRVKHVYPKYTGAEGREDIAVWRNRQAAIDAEVIFLDKFFLEGR